MTDEDASTAGVPAASAEDSSDYPPNRDPYAPRRRDRAMDDAWIRSALDAGAYGVLATVNDGQPFLNSNLYVYDADQHCIYMHTARVGQTRRNLEGEPEGSPVCFTVTAMGRLLPADEALEFSVEYSGVVVFGAGFVVEDDGEKTRGLQLLLDRYAPHLRPGQDYRPITPDELKRTAVYRIDIQRWAGKQKQVADDFPGAFQLPGGGFPLA